MPGRTPKAAVDAFLSPLNESTCCLLSAPWAYTRPKDGKEVGGLYTALLNWGRAVPIQDRPLQVEGVISFTVVEQDINKRGERVNAGQRFKISTRAYYYTLSRPAGDCEIVAWHWHPDSKSNVEYPHMHIGSGELSHDAVLSGKDHVPTGRVAFEHVLIQLKGMGAEPVHQNWLDVLQRNIKAFTDWRTWH